MKFGRTKKLAIIAGASAVLVLSIALATNNTANTIPVLNGTRDAGLVPGATASMQCLSEEEAKSKTTLQYKTPTNLPVGYTYACADSSQYDAYVLYWNNNMTDDKIDRSELVMKGAIAMSATLMNESTDPAYHIKDRKAEVESMYLSLRPEQKPRLVEINGNLAYVREQCDKCGIVEAEFEDGSKIVENYGLPSRIGFYDGDIWYILEANIPSSELELVAKSLK